MLQLYGIPRSRANRCLWMLEEMGQPYELVEKSAHPDDLRTAAWHRPLDPFQTCGDSQVLSPQPPQRLVIKRAEMRESPESGREPSRTSDQPIRIEVVNTIMRP